MNHKEALELQNMFTTAAQIAKSRNQYEYNFKIQEAVFVELFKKAFPSMRDNINLINIAKNCYYN